MSTRFVYFNDHRARRYLSAASLFDERGSQKVASLVEKAKQRNISIVFPVDHVIADKFDKDAKVC